MNDTNRPPVTNKNREQTGIKDAFRTPIGGITRIEMDKETKQRKEILRRLNILERRVDKDWRAQNAINEFDCRLILNYSAKLLFFKKAFSKVWKIELKNRADGFHWEIKIV